MKRVFVYDYASTNGFVEYFQMLAGYSRPWLGEKVWETLDGELKLGPPAMLGAMSDTR